MWCFRAAPSSRTKRQGAVLVKTERGDEEYEGDAEDTGDEEDTSADEDGDGAFCSHVLNFLACCYCLRELSVNIL